MILVVEAAELSLYVEALSSYRNTEDFELEGVLVDPDKSTDVATYSWSCTPAEGGLCFAGTALPEVIEGKYLVPANSLALGTYKFMVKVTKGTRTAMEDVEITIVDGMNYPPVGVARVVCSGQACKFEKPVLADEPLRLEVRITKEDKWMKWLPIPCSPFSRMEGSGSLGYMSLDTDVLTPLLFSGRGGRRLGECCI